MGITSRQMRKRARDSIYRLYKGMPSGIIHVSVMNMRSISCYSASSRISDILLRMEKVFNNANLIRQLYRSEEYGDSGVKGAKWDGSVRSFRFVEVVMLGICLFLCNFGIECHYEGDREEFGISEGNGVGVGDWVICVE